MPSRKKSGIRVHLNRADAIGIVRQMGLDPAVGVGHQLMEFWEALEAERLSRWPPKKPGQAANGYAGYGHVYRGRRGKRKRVEHEHEMRTIRWIVTHKLAGYSWTELCDHLRENGVVTAKGKPWSIMRVRRAYQAAVKAGMVAAESGSGEGQDGSVHGDDATNGTGSSAGLPSERKPEADEGGPAI